MKRAGCQNSASHLASFHPVSGLVSTIVLVLPLLSCRPISSFSPKYLLKLEVP